MSELELGPFPQAVACARLHTRAVLAEWGVPRDLVADAELICSELITNALRAAWALAEPRPVGLRLLASGERLVIEAWDCHPGDPLLRAPSGETAADWDEAGRGLAIVAELAHRWGSRRTGEHLTATWANSAWVKAVWAELALPERATVFGPVHPRKEGWQVSDADVPDTGPETGHGAGDLPGGTEEPSMGPPVRCTCGAAFATPDELDEHFWSVFVPPDDIGLDGKVHAEVSRDRPRSRRE